MDWGRKWLVDFNAGKTQLVLFDHSNKTGAIDVKIDGLFFDKNHLLRCRGWLSLLNWIGDLTLSLLLKLSPRKLEIWFVLWSFFLLNLLFISINLPYDHAWSTVVMSGLVLLIATWNYWISNKGYAGLLVLHSLLFLNIWLNWFHFFVLEGGLLVILIECMIFLSPFLDVKRMSISTVSFVVQLSCGILCR